VHHVFAGLGSAVSLFPPSTWFSTGIVLASVGALIGTLTLFRSR
jgi:hypothetical protein